MKKEILVDAYGTPLAVGDIVEDETPGEGHNPWRYHYVEDVGYGPTIRDFAAHNVGMCWKPKRLGPWNDPDVVKVLIDAGIHTSAKEIEIDVWELMDPDGRGQWK